MHKKPLSLVRASLKTGAISGAISILLTLIGLVEAFGQRNIINGVITMGQIFYLAPIFLMANNLVKDFSKSTQKLISGIIVGLTGGFLITFLVLVGNLVHLRAIFINSSPALYQILTAGLGYPVGLIIPLLEATLAGLAAALLFLLPARVRSATIQALIWVIAVGLLRDLILTIINRWGVVALVISWMFALNGLSIFGAISLFALVGGLYYWRTGLPPKPVVQRSPVQQRNVRFAALGALAILLILLPPVLGIFFSEVLDNVGLFILMGLGLNIVVGFAGLLDLGYVAFYAIGAYTMGVLTSPELGFYHLTYWQALPVAMVMSATAGLLLGLPVLKMRGDYLAIVTLGFGEIVRLLFLSDWLRPWLGGTQGIQQIARPHLGGYELATQEQLYYLILVGIALVGFIAVRLKDSRLGRAWMALREDEDVATAMGINNVTTKLMAFAVGALFSGLGGTIFAAKLTSAYPSSFNFLVSINVLSLIIIGGIGSIPGVFVGALALIGLPELLREFQEFRLLVYGAALVFMMLKKPEGLWPEERRKLELHETEEYLATSSD